MVINDMINQIIGEGGSRFYSVVIIVAESLDLSFSLRLSKLSNCL